MVASAAAGGGRMGCVDSAGVREDRGGGEWSWTQPKPAASYDFSSGAEAHHSFGTLSPSLPAEPRVREPGSARASREPVVCSTAIATRFALEPHCP